jgi:hypothetical protein
MAALNRRQTSAPVTAPRCTPLQQRLVRELDTDPAATPATQTTRLVSYANHKYSPAHFVTINYRHAVRLYMPTDFPSVVSVVRRDFR